MTWAEGEACARAALAGNPSDGYGGAVLAVTLGEQRARALARPAPGLRVSPDNQLVAATAQRFARDLVPAAAATAIEWTTSVPRAVGLGGSSAIVIATLRALCSLHAVILPRSKLAELALAIEVEELGITAGLQDRVAQAYGGLTFMDFGPAAGRHRYERLDPTRLPPLLVAWRPDAAQESGAVHAPLRRRFNARDRVVSRGLSELARLAARARTALLTGDQPELARCVDGSFNQRRQMLELDPRHTEMIEAARAGGASANYAGSGGAIVAVCADTEQRERATRELSRIGCRLIAPEVGRPPGHHPRAALSR